jgi:hypothetical protein
MLLGNKIQNWESSKKLKNLELSPISQKKFKLSLIYVKILSHVKEKPKINKIYFIFFFRSFTVIFS